MEDIVSFEVAKFLYTTYQYKNDTVYLYDLSGRLHISLEPKQTFLISAPTLLDTINFLWNMGIKIYYAPKKGKCIPLVVIGNDVTELRELCNTPSDSYRTALNYLARLYKEWENLKKLEDLL